MVKIFDKKSGDKKVNSGLMKCMNMGIEFGVAAAVFCYVGYKIDAALETSPIFLLGGFFVSFIGMLYLTFKQIKNMWRK